MIETKPPYAHTISLTIELANARFNKPQNLSKKKICIQTTNCRCFLGLNSEKAHFNSSVFNKAWKESSTILEDLKSTHKPRIQWNIDSEYVAFNNSVLSTTECMIIIYYSLQSACHYTSTNRYKSCICTNYQSYGSKWILVSIHWRYLQDSPLHCSNYNTKSSRLSNSA